MLTSNVTAVFGMPFVLAKLDNCITVDCCMGNYFQNSAKGTLHRKREIIAAFMAPSAVCNRKESVFEIGSHLILFQTQQGAGSQLKQPALGCKRHVPTSNPAKHKEASFNCHHDRPCTGARLFPTLVLHAEGKASSKLVASTVTEVTDRINEHSNVKQSSDGQRTASQ